MFRTLSNDRYFMFPPSSRRKSRDRSCANFKNFLYILERTFWQTQKHKQNADLSNHDWLSWFAANTSRAKFRSTCVSSATHTFEYVKVQAVCRYARTHIDHFQTKCQQVYALSLSLAAELQAGRTSDASANFGATNVRTLTAAHHQ